MATSNGGFLHTDPPTAAPTLLPPWLSNSNSTSTMRPPSPSVTLSLSPSTVAASPPIVWLQPDRGPDNTLVLSSMPPHGSIPACGENLLMSELMDCCRELDEGHRAWVAHKREAAWRLRRVELQLDSEKSCRRREKMEEIESKIKTLREEQKASIDRIEAEYGEQLAGLRKDAEAKEQKLAEQWAAKHVHLTKLLEQMACRPRLAQPSGR